MNYKMHEFVNDLVGLVQRAVNAGIPIYVIPYFLKDVASNLTPAINQAIQNETPTSEPVGEQEWHANESLEESK